MKKQFDFNYVGFDDKNYNGKFILRDEKLESFSYFDPELEEWIDCDRSDVSKQEIQEAWEKGNEID